MVAALPVAVLACVFDADHRLLLLRRPGDTTWQIVSGAMEHGESVCAAAIREVEEETGLHPRPLGVAHTYSFRGYGVDIVSVVYVFAHTGGDVRPGDDMQGAQVRWAAAAELEVVAMSVPGDLWVLRRAAAFHQEHRTAPPADLEPHWRR